MTKTTEGFLPVTLRLPHTAVWKDRDALWRFMDLLFMCSFSDGKVFFGGKEVEVKRGECIVSKRELALRWNMTRKRVDAFLRMLTAEGLCGSEATVGNYTRINVSNMASGATKGAIEGATEGATKSATSRAERQKLNRLVGATGRATGSATDGAINAATYTRNTNIRNYKKKENLYIREKELDLEDKYNNPDNFLW